MSRLQRPPRRRNVREIETLEALAERGSDLHDLAVQNLDLRQLEVDWDDVDVRDTIFLGCTFPTADVERALQLRGAVVFPRFAERPYDPYRSTLYSPDELDEPCEWGGVRKSREEHIYDWYTAAGKHLPDVGEALAQRMHDLAIDDALGDLVGESSQARLDKRIVGIMGGHVKPRDTDAYRQAARVAWRLGKDHLIVTGGGPGIMEAGNLGAYLSGHDEATLESALESLGRAPTPEDPGYRGAARDVLAACPGGKPSVAVPTWFYGFEPSNLFAPHIAKYFSNGIREDGLLAICLHGIVFADGSAGTVQEVFMDAAQNHYATFGYRSAMAFLGRERYEPSPGVGIFPTLRAEGKDYASLLGLSDSPDEVAEFIRDHPPE